MAIIYGASINLSGNEIQNFRVHNLAAAPTATKGASYFDTGVNKFLGYNGTSWIDLSAGGTVTSVGLSLPAIFNVTNSPVTGVGTLTATLTSQAANTVWAAPNGSAGSPTFRLLAAADIPALAANIITSGILATTVGGTGVNGATAANGTLLIGNGTGYTLANLTAGTGIGIANGSGSITISNTGVTSLVAGTNISVSASTGAVTVSTSATPSFTSLTVNGQVLTAAATPALNTDIITYGYILNQSFGFRDFKESVKYMVNSLSGLTYTATAGTYSNGQITVAPNTLNATALVVGDRILLNVTGGNAANGIYVVTTVGTGANGVWNRAQDFSNATNTSLGAYAYVEAIQAGYILAGPTGNLTIGGASGSVLVFNQFMGAGTYLAGSNLTLTGNTFALNATLTGLTAVTTAALTVGSLAGLLKATAGVVSAATVGVDYLAPSAISGTTNNIPKFASTSTIGASLLSDNGTTLTYTGTAGITAPALTASGLTVGAPVRTTTGGLLTTGATVLSGTEVSGILPVAKGGTGLNGSTAANGSLLIGNGTGYTLATLTAGANITISNSAGGITISATAGGAGTVNKYVGTITGDGTSTSFAVTHNLNTNDVVCVVRDNNSPNVTTWVEQRSSSVNAITLVFGIAPSNGTVYNVVIIG